MSHATGHDRSQTLLLPEPLDEYVGPENPVRFIDAFVDELDLTAGGFIRVASKVTARPGYAPARLRVFDASEHATFMIGQYAFRPAAKLLTDRAGRRLRLTNKEVDILKFLYRAGAKVVTRAILLDGVWGYNAGVTSHTLETHIYRLRQKIEANPARCQMLVTDHGGYRLNVAIAA
jgi:DNA-binding response OmpR family regulator